MTRAVGSRSRLWSGLILIILGVLFLLDRLGYIRFGEFVETWWPIALIVFGLWCLLASRRRRWGFSLFLIALGVLLQGERLGWFGWWSLHNLWPLLLILTGGWLLVGRLRASAPQEFAGIKEESGEIVDAFVIWGGLERAVVSKQFRGGEATALMGGIEPDLRRAELAPGEQWLKLMALMGGIKVRVPGNWQVTVEGTPLMGGIEDSRKPAAPAAAPETTTAGGRLVVQALALMGGIEVTT